MNPLQLHTNPSSNGLPGLNSHNGPVAQTTPANPSPAAEPAGDGPATPSQNFLNPEPRTLNPAKRGPPLLFDDEKRRFYCTLLRQGVPRAKAAHLLGIAPRTVQKTIKNDPELALRIRQARLDCHSRAAAQVVRAGDCSWRAAAWVLEQEKRRRGPGRPRAALARLTDPSIRDELKKFVRGVLLEVMPELRQEITARRPAASPLAAAASEAVQSYLGDRNARMSAMAAEAKALHQRGQSVDFGALWEKHLPDVPRRYTGSKAHIFPPPNPQPPIQTDTAQNLASDPADEGSPIDAHFP
jgi:hypothetical protein